MSKKVWDVVRGAGFLTAIFSKLSRYVAEIGGSEEKLHELSTEAGNGRVREMARIAVFGETSASDYQLDALKRLLHEADTHHVAGIVLAWLVDKSNHLTKEISVTLRGKMGRIVFNLINYTDVYLHTNTILQAMGSWLKVYADTGKFVAGIFTENFVDGEEYFTIQFSKRTPASSCRILRGENHENPSDLIAVLNSDPKVSELIAKTQ